MPTGRHHRGRASADFGPNEWLVDELYQRYLADPGSVDMAWWNFFADYTPPAGRPGQPPTPRTPHRPAFRSYRPASPASPPGRPAAADRPAAVPRRRRPTSAARPDTAATRLPRLASSRRGFRYRPSPRGQPSPRDPPSPRPPGPAPASHRGAQRPAAAPATAGVSPDRTAAPRRHRPSRWHTASRRASPAGAGCGRAPAAGSVRPDGGEHGGQPHRADRDQRPLGSRQAAHRQPHRRSTTTSPAAGGKVSFTHLIGYAVVRRWPRPRR